VEDRGGKGAGILFLGEYRHSIDKKGRLIVPAGFRPGLGSQFIMTRGLDHCLFVYPADEWQTLEEKLRLLPMTRKDARAFVRFLFSGATACEMDKQGRVLIPANLREYAGLGKDVVVIGVSNRVEIWDAENWNAYAAGAEESYEEIAETIVDLGI